MTRSRWLWMLVLACACAVSVRCGVCLAAGEPARIQTKWLSLEFDPASGALTGLAADPAGAGKFTRPVASALDTAGYGVFAACRAPDGQILTAQPGASFGITADQNTVAVTGLRVGDAIAARLDVSAAAAAPELTVRATLRAEAETSVKWAGLLLALDPALAPSTVYFVERQGLASISPGRLSAARARFAGAVCKEGAERTFVLTPSPVAGVEIETAPGRAAIAVAPAIGGAPITLRAGDTVTVTARLVFGLPRVPQLKATTGKFQPLAQDFIFWTSQIATTRPFGDHWAQMTAAVIDPRLPADAQQACRRCWLRDAANAWKSGSLVAGDDMLAVMRDEITAFAGKLDESGQPPTSLGPDGDATYGELDSAGLLIGMIYDYFCRTGDAGFVRSLLPPADRMGAAIAKLIGPRDLPVIKDGDTYPDIGVVKGEQTYLAVICYDALRKLARLHEIIGDAKSSGTWQTAANRIQLAANRPTDRGGLWDYERGVFIGWRRPDDYLHRDEDSFANLLAIQTGLCADGERVRAIFARFNSNDQRYYLDSLCPTALSFKPYPGGLDQWAPWVGGWDVYLRARLSEPYADKVWSLFWADYLRTDFPYRQAAAVHQQEASVGNRGRLLDSWGLLQAIYAGHYGIEMTPAHLRILPRPIELVIGDEVSGLRWRDATCNIELHGRGLHLARLTVDGKDWPSCVLSPGGGEHTIEITCSSAARAAFVVDAAPTLAVLAAEQRPKGIRVEASVPSAGRYWIVLQWPAEFATMNVAALSGAQFPQVSRLQGERAAVIFTVRGAGKVSLTLEGRELFEPRPPRP